jgi:penicillin-binding protein 2
MAGRRGTAVVLDVSSGRLLAAYHPDVAARLIASPGSSIKPFTLLTLLQTGKVDSHTALLCRRATSIQGHTIDCVHPRTGQPLTPDVALAYSCNSYFTSVATRLTPTELRDGLLHAGFGATTGLASPEGTGAVMLADSQDELELQAIGEWGIRVTPFELASAYRNLALLSQTYNARLTPLFDGLQQSVSYGMGHLAQPDSPITVAGKTGTASGHNQSWTHAWFAGYAPASKPEIVVVVFLEKGHGGGDAALVARDIFGAYARSRGVSASQAVKETPQ